MNTKGNVKTEDIKVGDIHYEYEYGCFIKSQVITEPKLTEYEGGGYWTWEAKNLLTGRIINYGCREGYSHYAPNLYDYEAYRGCKQL